MRRAMVVGVLLAAACNKPSNPAATPAPTVDAAAAAHATAPLPPLPPPACADADCLPAFRTTTIDGQAVTTTDLAGKVALVMFWASWCEPCTQEGPGLSEVFAARGPEGFALLGFSKDQATDADLRVFRDRHHLGYPIAKLDAATEQAFGAPPELPTFILYGRDGHRRMLLTGALPAPVLDREISAALSRPKGAP